MAIENEQLAGLTEYLEAHYQASVFDQAEKQQGSLWTLHIHGGPIETGKIKENKRYEIQFIPESGEERELQKLEIKFLYPADYRESILKLVKIDQKVKGLMLEPIKSPNKRHHVKNKTLYPLMNRKEVLFFTLLEGEVLRGLVTEFSRYEIILSVKGGLPIHILRHAVHDIRDKRNKCYLKKAIEGK